MTHPTDERVSEEMLAAIDDSFGPRVTVIYDRKWFGLRNLGISQQGWLVVQHPDGQWVTLADLKPHFVQPETDEAKVCALLAKRVAELERELLAARQALREAERDTQRLMFITHNYKRINFWGMADDDVRAAIDAAMTEDGAPPALAHLKEGE